MISRIFKQPKNKSFFLFGPRGVGKSTWLKTNFPSAPFIDLLDSATYFELLAAPHRLSNYLHPAKENWVIIDEIQRVPQLLNEVHRIIENQHIHFVLTGSSARKLRTRGTNLLAGRALTKQMHGLTAAEIGEAFDISHALRYGTLPSTLNETDPKAYLEAYVKTYLREEVQEEGLTRSLANFSRFLEAATFSQGAMLNISEVARECHIERKVVEGYFHILEDLLLSIRLTTFSRRAKRKTVSHPKFYFTDPGIYRTLRPKGPLDLSDEIDGAALETIVLHELRANNDYFDKGYTLNYWRTRQGEEVDFVLYGEQGFHAVEVKRTHHLRSEDFSGLYAFHQEYPSAQLYLVYGGDRLYREGPIQIIPIVDFCRRVSEFI